MIETKFKNTEIGLIPEDWEVKTIVEAFDIIKERCDASSFDNKYYISTENLLQNKNGVSFYQGQVYGSVIKYQVDDILISNIRPYLKKIWLSNCNGGCSADVLVFRCKEEMLIAEMGYMLLSDDSFFNFVNESTLGTKMPRGDKKMIPFYQFPLPPLPEQRRIAEVLSQADELIKQWENVIAKKRDIKTATMQLLLTGKKRLKGFDKPWVEKKLGEVKIENGQMLNSSDYIKGNIPVIAGGKGPAGYHNIPNRYSNTITISGSGANAGYVAYHSQPIFASDCSTINDQDGIFVKYLFYVLVLLQNDIYKCQAGGAQPHIHAKDIKDISFYLPDLTEQRAIAEILSDMDEEIKTLEAKVEKLRNIKSGMMQQLLSGKIRLVGDEADNVRQFVENNFGQMPNAAEDEAEFGL